MTTSSAGRTLHQLAMHHPMPEPRPERAAMARLWADHTIRSRSRHRSVCSRRRRRSMRWVPGLKVDHRSAIPLTTATLNPRPGRGHHAHERGEGAGARQQAVGAGRPCRCLAAGCLAVWAAGGQAQEEILASELKGKCDDGSYLVGPNFNLCFLRTDDDHHGRDWPGCRGHYCK